MLPQPKALHGINQGIILTVVRSGTDDFIFKDFTFGSYTHSTSEPSALSLRVTVVGKVFSINVPEEDSHPERGNLFPSRMGLTLVRSSLDDYFNLDAIRIA